jgi:uncharacterized protein (DUF2147 family)
MNIKKTLFTFFLIVMVTNLYTQTIFGKWHSKNEATGELDSVIEVYEKDGKAYAKVIEILNKKVNNPVCQNCEGVNRDTPILGMDILSGLEKDEDKWSGGEILDPRNGKVYKCLIKLEKKDLLKLRGYIGISWFGKTAYWYRALP